MTALFALLQGAGCGAAIGVRPFLPALLIGALASADIAVDYDGTSFEFLESTGFLFALVVLTAIATFARRYVEHGPGASAMQGLAIGLAAVEGAGMLDDVSDTWWPGLIAGGLAALLGLAASSDLLSRAAKRLDAEAAAMLFLYAEAFALMLAGVSLAFPPLAVIGIGLLAWLLLGGRRRDGEKFAGLRSLR
jgi:hypothetical protein